MSATIAMVIAAVFSAPQVDTAESLVVEVVTTHMSVIRLANELTRNAELAELPGVDGAALRASFQPELEAYQQCIATYFALAGASFPLTTARGLRCRIHLVNDLMACVKGFLQVFDAYPPNSRMSSRACPQNPA